MYFTEDDLIEIGELVLQQVHEHFPHTKLELGDIYMPDRDYIKLTLFDDKGDEFEYSLYIGDIEPENYLPHHIKLWQYANEIIPLLCEDIRQTFVDRQKNIFLKIVDFPLTTSETVVIIGVGQAKSCTYYLYTKKHRRVSRHENSETNF